MLNVVDGGSQAALGIADDAVSHLSRRKSGIEPNNADNWNVDVGQDIDRHPHDDQWRYDRDDERQHDKRVRTL